MTDVASITTVEPLDLLNRYGALQRSEPNLRVRDAAGRLGVSEAELVAARCGRGVVRLDGRWGALLEALPGLGPVMTLTRNEYAVHEKVGRYEPVSVSGDGALVTGPDIDLRIRHSRWRFGYAVTDKTERGVRQSLQFFDAAGTAVHKIYLREDSDVDAYARLIAAHVAEDQSAGERVDARAPRARPRTDEVDVEALRRRWRALEDVHQFSPMLRDLKVSRVRACELVGPEFAERVEPDSFRIALERAAAESLPIMVFVPSPGVVQIHTGPVKNLKRVGEWFNVLDPGFNLHLRDGGIAAAWILRKPTTEGVVTSLEIFDADGGQIAWMFGQRDRGAPERPEWRRLVDGLERTESAAAE